MPQLVSEVNEFKDHIRGRSDAPVTLVAYGDYECPHCGRASALVKVLQEKLGPKLRYVFRNFPLSNMYPDSFLAAQAAEAAGAQGRFWEMHDLLFENQESLMKEDLVKYAESLGLDAEAFLRDLDGGAYADRVSADLAGGAKSGVNGTPCFFINGERYDESWDGEGLLDGLLLELRSVTARERDVAPMLGQ